MFEINELSVPLPKTKALVEDSPPVQRTEAAAKTAALHEEESMSSISAISALTGETSQVSPPSREAVQPQEQMQDATAIPVLNVDTSATRKRAGSSGLIVDAASHDS